METLVRQSLLIEPQGLLTINLAALLCILLSDGSAIAGGGMWVYSHIIRVLQDFEITDMKIRASISADDIMVDETKNLEGR